MSKKKKQPKTLDMKWDTMIRNLNYEKEPEDAEKRKNWLKPRVKIAKHTVR